MAPTDTILTAPLEGWSTALGEVPDEVFAGGLLGDGIAIDPIEGVLYAPCDGELIASLSLQSALPNNAVTELPAAAIGPQVGQHDLCFRFSQRSLDPLWVIDQVRLLE